jgi:hypothetical protein
MMSAGGYAITLPPQKGPFVSRILQEDGAPPDFTTFSVCGFAAVVTGITKEELQDNFQCMVTVFNAQLAATGGIPTPVLVYDETPDYTASVKKISVVIDPRVNNVMTDGELQFEAQVESSDTSLDRSVVWTVKGRGTINSRGLYTAPPVSNYDYKNPVDIIVCYCLADITSFDSVEIQITTPPYGSKVELYIHPTTLTLEFGGAFQFTTFVRNTGNHKVRWDLVKSDIYTQIVGSVNATGEFTAPYIRGRVFVRATSLADETVEAYATVLVAPAVQGEDAPLFNDATPDTSLPDYSTESDIPVFVIPPPTDYVPHPKLEISPIFISLECGKQYQFTTNAEDAVSWNLVGPGTLSGAGLYTAPTAVPPKVNGVIVPSLLNVYRDSEPTIVKTASIYVIRVSATEDALSSVIGITTNYEEAPKISAFVPSDGAAVMRTQVITAVFDRLMDLATINQYTFLVNYGSIAGAVAAYNTAGGCVATFTTTFPVDTTCVVTILSSVKSTNGIPLKQNYYSTFTVIAGVTGTGILPPIAKTIPHIIFMNPAFSESSVLLSAKVVVKFDCIMAVSTVETQAGVTPNTANSIQLTQVRIATGPPQIVTPISDIRGLVTYDAANKTATFTPEVALQKDTDYRVRVSGPRSSDGGNLAPVTWLFKTMGDAVIIPLGPPTVMTIFPLNNATGVSIKSSVIISMDQAIAVASVTPAAVNVCRVVGGVRDVPALEGTIAADVSGFISWTQKPTAPATTVLQYSSSYEVYVFGVCNLSSNTMMTAPFVSRFSTGNKPPVVLSVAPIDGTTGVSLTGPIVITFDSDILAASVNASNITFNGPVTTFNYSTVGKVVTITPATSLAPNFNYTVKVQAANPTLSITGLKEIGGAAIEATYTFAFITADVFTIVSTQPAFNASGINKAAGISVTFNYAADPATITTANIYIQGVAGSAAYGSVTKTATFTPSAPLLANTSYTAFVTVGVKSAGGTPMLAQYSWSFTTAVSDVIPFSITSRTPAVGATGVGTAVHPTITFNNNVDLATLTASNFNINGVGGTVTYDAPTKTATFTPTAALDAGVTYTVTAYANIQDVLGTSLTLTVWSFTTVLPPFYVALSTPINGAVGIGPTISPVLYFPQAVDLATMSAATVNISGVTATLAYDAGAKSITLTPTATLAYSTTYTLNVTSGLKNTLGTACTAWSVMFTTQAAPVTTFTVSSNTPANGATGVSSVWLGMMWDVITVTFNFSEALDASTVAAAFSVTPGFWGSTGTAIYTAGSTTLSYQIVMCALTSTYTITIANTLKAASGHTFAGYTTAFTTS